jgi:hypothetical protein
MRTWTRTALDGREKHVFINETPVIPLIAQSGNICAITSNFNFITWERAYSIFGFLTFIEKTAYPLTHLRYTDNAPYFLASYAALGFDIGLVRLDDQSASPPAAGPRKTLVGKRRIGDSRSWIVPLRTAGIRASRFPSHLVNFASFSVQHRSDPDYSGRDTFVHYGVQAHLFKHHSLRHQYVLPSAPDEDRCFEDRTVLSLYLVEPRHLLSNFDLAQVWGDTGNRGLMAFDRDGLNLEALEGWSLPADSGWKYYDYQMLETLQRCYLDYRAKLEG